MNTYLINPSLFYWFNVTESLRMFAVITLVVSAAAFCTGTLKLCMDTYSAKHWPTISESEMKAIPGDKKFIKYSAIVLAITSIMTIFIPSKETLIYMEVAKLATVENAEMSIEAVKAAVDYIVESIKSVNAGG